MLTDNKFTLSLWGGKPFRSDDCATAVDGLTMAEAKDGLKNPSKLFRASELKDAEWLAIYETDCADVAKAFDDLARSQPKVGSYNLNIETAKNPYFDSLSETEIYEENHLRCSEAFAGGGMNAYNEWRQR